MQHFNTIESEHYNKQNSIIYSQVNFRGSKHEIETHIILDSFHKMFLNSIYTTLARFFHSTFFPDSIQYS